MEKIVTKRGDSTIITLSRADKQFYNIDIGDRIIFTITEVIKSEKNIQLAKEKEDGESSIVLD